MNLVLLNSHILSEMDVMAVCQRTRQIASLLDLEPHARTRVVTAVSEIARNALIHAGGGRVQYALEGDGVVYLMVRVEDDGPGLPAQLDGLLADGSGLMNAQRLMDLFRSERRADQGSRIVLGKALPAAAAQALTKARLLNIGATLVRHSLSSPLDEIRQQNQELLRALEDLRLRQLTLDRLYAEGAANNAHLQAANARLAEQAEALQQSTRAAQVARTEAEAAVAGREALLAVVSHDLRNPLGAIVASAQLLARQSQHIDAEEVRTQVHRRSDAILRAAQRMERLIRDLLDLATLQAGHLLIDCARHSVDAILEEILEVLTPMASVQGIALTSAAPRGLALTCDRGRLLQIINNLVGNAVKFTPAGGRVHLQVRAAGDEVAFAVADTGIGMAQDARGHVFEQYWQAQGQGEGARAGRGVGLGLSIVQGLVRAHGGRIWVESEEGQGTTFHFALPRAPALPPSPAPA